MSGYGWTPYFVEGSDPDTMHQAMAATVEHCVSEIRERQRERRTSGVAKRPRWPMIVLRSPKGWSCAAGSRRPQARRFLACASSPTDRRQERPRATAHSGKLDEVPEAGRAF